MNSTSEMYEVDDQYLFDSGSNPKHEINNPLEAIMSLLYLAQTVNDTPGEVLEYLKTADGELKRIAHITRQTLGFYRETTSPTSFNVGSLLDSVLDLLQAKIKAKRAVVNKECDEQLQIDSAVYRELRQVLSNLLLNSLDALDENETVTLRASMSFHAGDGSSCVRITIADNGHGIGPSTLPQIFEPFFTTKGSIGNGLGLWISKQIIEKHGGAVQVHSSINCQASQSFNASRGRTVRSLHRLSSQLAKGLAQFGGAVHHDPTSRAEQHRCKHL